jgi:hypothetical protein
LLLLLLLLLVDMIDDESVMYDGGI